MLLSGLVMFFNTSLIEIFTRLTDYTWGNFRRCCRYGVGKLRRRAKVLLRRLASQQILFCCTLCVRLHYCHLLSPE